MEDVITQDGETVDAGALLAPGASMAVQLQKAEIDQLVSTARAFPRSLKLVQTRIMSMATLDEESAEECVYALPRGGKPIRGPSIRFAEILKQSYGNCQSAARVVHVDRDEKYVEAEGVFIDLETNSKSTARVRRRISDRHGRVLNEDMIIVTGNAACSIAMRNAILAGVPKPLWRKAYDSVQATITGDITTLSENREKAFKALAAFGVKPEQIYAALGIVGLEDISVDHIATLRGMYSALKNGEATVEEMFSTAKPASNHDKIADPLSDDVPAPKGEAGGGKAEKTASMAGAPVEATSSDLFSGTGDRGGPGAADGDAKAKQAAPSPDTRMPDADMDWLRAQAKRLAAATAPRGDMDILGNAANDIRDNHTPKEIGAAAREKLDRIRLGCEAVTRGEEEPDEVRQRIATVTGLKPAEIGGLA